MNPRLNSKGITLVTTVILLVFASIVILGLTTFVIQRLSVSNIRLTQTRTIYSAQAGIHKAIYDYRVRNMSGIGYITLGQSNIDSNDFYVIGGSAADLLMVNTGLSVIKNYWNPN